MKITRVIDGKEYEFELTFQEQWKAWNEWQNRIAREEAEAYIDNYLASRDEDSDITEADVMDAMDDIVERYLELESMKDNWDSLEEAFDWCLI